MIWRVALLLLISACVYAEGPKYGGYDAPVRQEFQNVYNDIRSPKIGTGSADNFTVTSLAVSTITLASSATITNLTVGTLTTSGALGKVIQSSATSITAATSTNGTALVDSGLAITMTPASTSSRVLISAVAEHLGIGNAGQTIVGRWVIDRSGVTVYDNVRASGNGQLLATNIYDTVPLLYVDSPNTVSSITYKIRFARAASSGTGSIFFNDGNAQSSMAMIEYAP